MKLRRLLLVGALALLGVTSAFAATDLYTWNGTCFDCGVAPSPAQAIITLSDYTPGNAITSDNFVSLEYHSSNFDLMFLKDASITAAGALPDAVLSGPVLASMTFGNLTDGAVVGLWSFTTSSDGTWDLALNGVGQDGDGGDKEGSKKNHPADHVNGFEHGDHFHHTSPVAEPETYAMLLAGLGLMGFVARRRWQNTAA